MYRLFVDDNFHYQDESERYLRGTFDTENAAVDAAKKIVDDFLVANWERFTTAEELDEHYREFGKDPFIVFDGERVEFSAWDYAADRCRALYSCSGSGDKFPISHVAQENGGPIEPEESGDGITAELESLDDYESPEDDFEDDYFPFRYREYWVIDELRKRVREMIDVADSPQTIRDLAAVRLAVGRLPFNTPNLHFVVLIGDSGSSYQIEISEDRFALSYGGTVDSDGYVDTVLEMETTGFRDGSTDPWELSGWFIDAKELIKNGAEIQVTDYEGIANLSWDVFEEEPWALYERAMSKDDDGPFFDLD